MNRIRHKVEELGRAILFGAQAWRACLSGVDRRLVIAQMFTNGVMSLSTTIMTGLFVGAIMAIQIDLQLKDFGARAYLGGLATSVTIRNVGPVLIAFILAGKVGAYTSAELASMRVTDQIDAIRCLGMNPIRYIVAPRMIAVTLSSFLLLLVGLTVTLIGGIAIATVALGSNAVHYIHAIPDIVSPWSVATGMFKSFVFGGLISWIACYRGYHATGGASGVGETVRKTAVGALVWIIVADFVLSWSSAAIHSWLGIGVHG